MLTILSKFLYRATAPICNALSVEILFVRLSNAWIVTKQNNRLSIY